MASIQKRPARTPGGSASYRVRFRDPAGAQRSKTFKTKAKATVFAATVEADKARGTYVDHSLGRMTLAEYADQWLAIQTFSESTREQTESRVRRHILPILGGTPLADVRASQVQSWIRGKQQQLAPRTVRVLFATLSAILAAAVDDERIPKNPCSAGSLKLPRVEERTVVPWTVEQVAAVRVALPERYRLLIDLTTGLGLRQGEVFGLAVDDVDFLRHTVTVQRQVKIVGSRLVFDLPKNQKVREIPLPDAVATRMAASLQVFPERTVVLPWETPAGAEVSGRLFLTSRETKPLNRNYVNSRIWKPALRSAGVDAVRANAMHSGRHFYASAQLEAGTSIRALAAYLGHSDPGFTLRTYTHLMPEAEDKARRAIDEVFLRLESVETGQLRGPDVAQDSP